jgi:hypothetical protein
VRFLARFVTGFWLGIICRLSSRRVLHDIKVAVFLEAPDDEQCFDRLEEGLDLIARCDPATLNRIRQHFAGILVFGSERFRAAHWSQSGRLCVLTTRYLQSSTLLRESVALTLVHENMHARLDQLGVGYTEGRRAAVEVLCAMAELAFARRISSDATWAKGVEELIDKWSTGGETPWSDRTMHEEKVQYLRELGAPSWIVTMVDRLARILHRRAA